MLFIDNQTVITADWLNKVENTVPSEGNVVLAKAAGSGIKVDTSTPTYPWVDLIGALNVREVGATAPALNELVPGIRAFSFAANDKMDFVFHIPHDYAPGTDLFIHTHWSHNGTAISGNLLLDYVFTYAKGHGQANFPLAKTYNDGVAISSISTHPRYQHQISEVQITNAGGDAIHLDRGLIEVDGLLLVTLTVSAIPTITGGSPNEPFILTVDIHYQSTGVGTKNKSPNFWA